MYTAVDVNVTDEVIGILRESVEHHGWISGRFQVKDSPIYRLPIFKEICNKFSANLGKKYEDVDYCYAINQNPPIACIEFKWFDVEADSLDELRTAFYNLGFETAFRWNKDYSPSSYTFSIWTEIKSPKIVSELKRMDDEWMRKRMKELQTPK